MNEEKAKKVIRNSLLTWVISYRGKAVNYDEVKYLFKDRSWAEGFDAGVNAILDLMIEDIEKGMENG